MSLIKEPKGSCVILCRTNEMCTIGFRSSLLHFNNLKWDCIQEQFTKFIIGYYPSPRLYRSERTLPDENVSEFEVTLKERDLRDLDLEVVSNWKNFHNEIYEITGSSISGLGSADSRTALSNDGREISEILRTKIKIKFYCFTCKLLRETTHCSDARFGMGAPKCISCGCFC